MTSTDVSRITAAVTDSLTEIAISAAESDAHNLVHPALPGPTSGEAEVAAAAAAVGNDLERAISSRHRDLANAAVELKRRVANPVPLRLRPSSGAWMRLHATPEHFLMAGLGFTEVRALEPLFQTALEMPDSDHTPRFLAIMFTVFAFIAAEWSAAQRGRTTSTPRTTRHNRWQANALAGVVFLVSGVALTARLRNATQQARLNPMHPPLSATEIGLWVAFQGAFAIAAVGLAIKSHGRQAERTNSLVEEGKRSAVHELAQTESRLTSLDDENATDRDAVHIAHRAAHTTYRNHLAATIEPVDFQTGWRNRTANEAIESDWFSDPSSEPTHVRDDANAGPVDAPPAPNVAVTDEATDDEGLGDDAQVDDEPQRSEPTNVAEAHELTDEDEGDLLDAILG